MTDLEYTLITLIVSYGTWNWGRNQGIERGVIAAVETMLNMGMINEDQASKFISYDNEE